ncbi:MAG: hypothetical protein IT377_05180 [Polyangiaceae bacterium]|nr:hypothetical protein [Polyangiaceae bacterium]
MISLALGASEDARLRELIVHSVAPSAGGATLVVRVVLPGEASIEALEQAYHALAAARGWLRQQVAADIHRKRTPDLDFQVFPSWEAAP